ncbi:MAG: hypothetical protein HFF18_00545 [Oscillospiraceae bacterium]|nr:hypothetical protein [Oscillospiraceae bacterium]
MHFIDTPTPTEIMLELQEHFLSLQSDLLLMDALLAYDQSRPLSALCGPEAYEDGLERVRSYIDQHAHELSFVAGCLLTPAAERSPGRP